MKLGVIDKFNLDHTKPSEDELKRREIYYKDIDSLIQKKFLFMAETDPTGASNFITYNPINKAVNFLMEFPDLEFDTPDARRYVNASKYAEHKKALSEHGYGYLIESMGKGSKSEVNELSMIYILQRRFIKIVENRPVVNSMRSGYNHLLHKDSIEELVGSTGLPLKLGNQLAEMCAYGFNILLTENDGSELVSVPASFDYNHYRFRDGVLNARTGEFTPNDTTTVCMHEVKSEFGYSTHAKEIFERFVDYLATVNGKVDQRKRKQIIGFMLYPVSYNPIDKDISVLFGSGGNGKSVLGNLMSLAYGSIGTASSFLKASKKADGAYKNIEITRAFSKNSVRFDEETFSHIEQAEQMKNFIDQKITYEKRDLQSSSMELYIRGIVMLNSNTTGVVGASRNNTWFTRRFRALNFSFVFDNDPVAKEWIKMATSNINGIYAHFTQGDILSWLMEKREEFTPEELEHPLPNVADELALGDDTDDGEVATRIIQEHAQPFEVLQKTYSLPSKIVGLDNLESVHGVVINKPLCREIGKEIGQPRLTRPQLIRLINEQTDDLMTYSNRSRELVFFEDDFLKPLPPKPTREEIVQRVAEEENMKDVTPVEEFDIDMDAWFEEQLALLNKPSEEEKPEVELAVITDLNGHVSNQTITNKVVTDINDLVFDHKADKSKMPKIFPDARTKRGDYEQESRMLILDFDHIMDVEIDQVLDKLKQSGYKMYVQESYRSDVLDFGVHVFMPMKHGLTADQWNVYRDMVGEELLKTTGLQYDTGHAGFRGVVNGSFHEIITLDGEVLEPQVAVLDYLTKQVNKADSSTPWEYDRMVVDTYLEMDSEPSRELTGLLECGDLDEYTDARNNLVFMLSNDLVKMQNRNALQNGVFDDLWDKLTRVVENSIDANEFLSVMNTAYGKLEN